MFETVKKIGRHSVVKCLRHSKMFETGKTWRQQGNQQLWQFNGRCSSITCMLLLSITFKFLTCILANNSIQHCKDQLYHPSHICGAIKSNLCGKEHKPGKLAVPISFKITARPYHHQMLSPFFRHPSRPQLSCQRNARGHSTRDINID